MRHLGSIPGILASAGAHVELADERAAGSNFALFYDIAQKYCVCLQGFSPDRSISMTYLSARTNCSSNAAETSRFEVSKLNRDQQVIQAPPESSSSVKYARKASLGLTES